MAEDLYYPQSLEDALDGAFEENASVSAIKFDIHTRVSSAESPFYKSIYLYMPESLSNPTNVSWDSQGIGVEGAAALGDLSWDTPENIAKNAGQNLVQGGSNLLHDMIAKLGGGSNVGGAELSSLSEKKAVNPYMKMLFRNVNFRNFEFLFKFTPHNPKESARIHRIIQEFRAAALPATTQAKGEAEGEGVECSKDGPIATAFHLMYPKELEIEYIYQGDTHPWLNKFKRCVITDLNVNYTGAGFYASMRDGFPAQTELRMTFSEIEMVYREDICMEGASY